MYNGKILLKTVVVSVGVAVITVLIQLISQINVLYAENNVLFSVVWGIMLIACGINAYLMSVLNLNTKDAENAVTSLYIQFMCFVVWSLLFFVYGNFIFAAVISVVLLASSNVSTVLFRRLGIKYCIVMILTELWTVYIVFVSMTRTIW